MAITVLQDATIGLTGRRGDVVVVDGVVRHAGPALTDRQIAGWSGAEILSLEGRTVLPGFWDHHVHFDQWSLSRQWTPLGDADDPAAVVAAMAGRLAQDRRSTSRPGYGLPVVGYGWTDGLWSAAPHRDLLDAISVDVGNDVELVLVSNDLHAAWLNTAALRRYGLPSDGDGVVREDDWFPIMADIRAVPAAVMDHWAAAAAVDAAARGVVGIVDFETADNLASWTRRVTAGADSLRVSAAVWPEHLEAAISRGLRTGDPLPGTDGLIRMGPLKVITDGSLNTRTAYCRDPYPGDEDNGVGEHGMLVVSPEQLIPWMERAHACSIESAIHAIGDHANTLVLDAFAATGARGVVEHAQLLDRGDVDRFATLDVGASVQPEHAMDDRDVADRHWAGRTDRAFAYGDLHRAGARLTFGSDAPVAALDPWVTLAAAVSRSRDGRPAWHPEQRLDREIAVAASTGVARAAPAVGEVADLVICEVDVRGADPDVLRSAPVAGTLLAGRWTHRRGL